MSASEAAIPAKRTHSPVAVPQLEALIEDCYPRLRRAAFVLTGRDADADDLAQETIVQILRSVKRFRGESRFETWAYGILLNQERRLRRSRERRQRLAQLTGRLATLLHAANSRGPAAADDDGEWRASLWRQVSQLPDAQRDCVFSAVQRRPRGS